MSDNGRHPEVKARIDPELYQRLRRAATAEDLTLSQATRRALRLWLDALDAAHTAEQADLTGWPGDVHPEPRPTIFNHRLGQWVR